MSDNRSEDIFDQVASDIREQIERLKSIDYVSKAEIEEYNEGVEDIKDTINDLQKSAEVIRRNDPASAQVKEVEVASLRKLLKDLENDKINKRKNYNEENKVSNFMDGEQNDTSRTTGNVENAVQTQMFQEQSDQLDVIHLTMDQLQQQARTMGDELLDQGELLDQMDDGMDTLGGKLNRGKKQLEWIYEKNRERWNDCCIVLLIIALIVLLVVAVVL
ncbi:hypothetical protein TPHA_0D02760 [Tetrapisispora phaffii CBS 4417]|uniref:t-SNARE coiled-coil homology domain-containing protein n=1 Tax=Tetrapisispora phaffii (strain ATCC 24235 / CBS 4417 / NBRC 1672 / NRRL Y-8282 / UCD 70-5) TaxID=1071381 RepID=G8BSU1_TETPH|nr:hypothetical protein TPHA_0D02760 [Tetrapisispora phaffii CBS 4417]CCE62912.1 hypothetical protein TPHA_0D02760 [Tetrapisispora phaffii CBS 4417]